MNSELCSHENSSMYQEFKTNRGDRVSRCIVEGVQQYDPSPRTNTFASDRIPFKFVQDGNEQFKCAKYNELNSLRK